MLKLVWYGMLARILTSCRVGWVWFFQPATGFGGALQAPAEIEFSSFSPYSVTSGGKKINSGFLSRKNGNIIPVFHKTTDIPSWCVPVQFETCICIRD